MLMLSIAILRVVSACSPTAATDDDLTLGRAIVGPPAEGSTTTNRATAATLSPFSTPPTTAAQCGQCSALPVRREDLNSRSITMTTGANPCATLSLDCNGRTQDSATVITFYDPAEEDVGSTFGTGSATATLQCTQRNEWTAGNGTSVAAVECISA